MKNTLIIAITSILFLVLIIGCSDPMGADEELFNALDEAAELLTEEAEINELVSAEDPEEVEKEEKTEPEEEKEEEKVEKDDDTENEAAEAEKKEKEEREKKEKEEKEKKESVDLSNVSFAKKGANPLKGKHKEIFAWDFSKKHKYLTAKMINVEKDAKVYLTLYTSYKNSDDFTLYTYYGAKFSIKNHIWMKKSKTTTWPIVLMNNKQTVYIEVKIIDKNGKDITAKSKAKLVIN